MLTREAVDSFMKTAPLLREKIIDSILILAESGIIETELQHQLAQLATGVVLDDAGLMLKQINSFRRRRGLLLEFQELAQTFRKD